MKISMILDQIDLGAIALPVFQRGYVWNSAQVRSLLLSLYRRHPVGSLLTWETQSESIDYRGEMKPQLGHVTLLLDGQQRITTLYGIVRGEEPPFFNGNPKTFKDLYFNIRSEQFQFYSALRMGQESGWFSVTELMQQGLDKNIERIASDPALSPDFALYMGRLNTLYQIRDIELHVEQVTGEKMTVDVVVDIFNNVNSGGTKLSKGDLALAKICANWPAARNELHARLERWRDAGYDFRIEWLLRCVNSVTTGEALFSALSDVSTESFRYGLRRSEKHIDYLLNLVSSRLGLDHGRVLKSIYSFPLMVRYIDKRGGNLSDFTERDKLLYWYIHTLLWGRYSGSTETVLNQDLELIEDIDRGLERLLGGLLRDKRGLTEASDFDTWSAGARFYPLLYMLTRVYHAKDWESGLELSKHMLGKQNSLQVHHIFPKSLLYKRCHDRREVNALANFTFLTQETNLKVANKYPADYLREYADRQPDLIQSHWIPDDPQLWKIENYRDFLQARRQLLSDAANRFLRELWAGSIPEEASVGSALDGKGSPSLFLEGDDEESLLRDTNAWVVEKGLSEGQFGYEVVDEEGGKILATFDLAWPDGLQEGYSRPIALLFGEDAEVERVANSADFRTFTDVESLKRYVKEEISPAATAAD